MPDLLLELFSEEIPARMQAQNSRRRLSPAVHSTGVKAVPACEPSQKGWLLERPQAHHQ